LSGTAGVLLYLVVERKGGSTMDNYSTIDRAVDYAALFLIGLIGWTCDHVTAFQSSIVANTDSKQGVQR